MTKTLTENRWFYTENGIKDASWNIVFKTEVLAPVPSYDEWQAELDSNNELLNVQKRLEKRLAIATKALEQYANCKPTEWMSCVTAHKALKEMEGVK